MSRDSYTLETQVTIPGLDPSKIPAVVKHMASRGHTEVPHNAFEFSKFVNALMEFGVFTGAHVSAFGASSSPAIAIFCAPAEGRTTIGLNQLAVHHLVAGNNITISEASDALTIWELTPENVERIASNIRAVIFSAADCG
jgi:hypothetical protein